MTTPLGDRILSEQVTELTAVISQPLQALTDTVENNPITAAASATAAAVLAGLGIVLNRRKEDELETDGTSAPLGDRTDSDEDEDLEESDGLDGEEELAASTPNVGTSTRDGNFENETETTTSLDVVTHNSELLTQFYFATTKGKAEQLLKEIIDRDPAHEDDYRQALKDAKKDWDSLSSKERIARYEVPAEREMLERFGSKEPSVAEVLGAVKIPSEAMQEEFSYEDETENDKLPQFINADYKYPSASPYTLYGKDGKYHDDILFPNSLIGDGRTGELPYRVLTAETGQKELSVNPLFSDQKKAAEFLETFISGERKVEPQGNEFVLTDSKTSPEKRAKKIDAKIKKLENELKNIETIIDDLKDPAKTEYNEIPDIIKFLKDNATKIGTTEDKISILTEGKTKEEIIKLLENTQSDLREKVRLAKIKRSLPEGQDFKEITDSNWKYTIGKTDVNKAIENMKSIVEAKMKAQFGESWTLPKDFDAKLKKLNGIKDYKEYANKELKIPYTSPEDIEEIVNKQKEIEAEQKRKQEIKSIIQTQVQELNAKLGTNIPASIIEAIGIKEGDYNGYYPDGSVKTRFEASSTFVKKLKQQMELSSKPVLADLAEIDKLSKEKIGLEKNNPITEKDKNRISEIAKSIEKIQSTEKMKNYLADDNKVKEANKYFIAVNGKDQVYLEGMGFVELHLTEDPKTQQKRELEAYEIAKKIDPVLAEESRSKGIGQIMGSNCKLCGYNNPQAMYKAFQEG